MRYSNLALVPDVEITTQSDSSAEPVSRPFGLTPAQATNFGCQVSLSGVSSQPAGTLKIQHTAGDGVWRDAGSETQTSVTYEEAQLGVRETFTLTFPAASSLTQAEGLRIRVDTNTAYTAVWFNIDADGTEPTGAWFTGASYTVSVDVDSDFTALEVAQAFWEAVDIEGSVSNDYDYTGTAPTEAEITYTAVQVGAYTGPSAAVLEDGSAGGAVTVTADRQGAATSGVPTATTLTYTSHGWVTGQRVVVRSSVSLLPTALSAGEAWVIRVDANTVSLAATPGGAAVDVTTGEGLLQAVLGDYTFRLLAKDSTDVTQLPLWPSCRVAYTGGGGSITVAEIRLR